MQDRPPSFNFDDYGLTFLARHLHRLRVVISEQSDAIFAQEDISVPSHCSSLIVFLHEHGEISVMKIANALGYSHQLVMQRIALLQMQNLVSKRRDPTDRRRSLISLNSTGQLEAKRVLTALPIIDAGIASVLSEVESRLQDELPYIREALLQRSLSERGRA